MKHQKQAGNHVSRQRLKIKIDPKRRDAFVLQTIDGWTIAVELTRPAQGFSPRLMAFVYNTAKLGRDAGCVAMAYDGALPHRDHKSLTLTGRETD